MEKIPPLTKTTAQLKELGHPFIGIQLKSGGKIFGQVHKFTRYMIYVETKQGDILDVPRKYIQRSLLMINGEKK